MRTRAYSLGYTAQSTHLNNMEIIMKKTLILAAILAALIGCQQKKAPAPAAAPAAPAADAAAPAAPAAAPAAPAAAPAAPAPAEKKK